MATKAVSFDKNKVKMLDLSSDKTAASTKKVVMEVNRIFMNQFNIRHYQFPRSHF